MTPEGKKISIAAASRRRSRQASRGTLAVLFLVAGILHFVLPALYTRIMPPFLPHPRLLVFVSGVCEICGGAGLLFPSTRRFAGVGLVALLFAVWPANFTMASQQWRAHGMTLTTGVLLLRLPLQIPLLLWARSASLRDNVEGV